jgi:membrane-associated phospholipid phosphatase
MAKSLSTAVGVFLLVATGTARADEHDAFDVRWELDLPIAAATGLAGGTMHMLREELVQDRCAPSCDRERVNALDATTLGTFSQDAADVGNILVATNVVLGPSVSLLAALGREHEDRWVHFAEDVALMGEVLGVSVFVHQLTTFAVQRPRPYVYGNHVSDELRRGANGYLSFYSGHTANAFAVASASSYLFMRRNPDSPFVVPLWTLSHGLAALQGYTRVTSGFHFWSDVLIGAVAGTSLGIAIPALHEFRQDELALSIAPMPLPGGGGVLLSL